MMAVSHQFYDSPLNIQVVEVTAKFLHPELFGGIDPLGRQLGEPHENAETTP